MITFTVWSDYLCPWCYVGSRRVQRFADEYGESVRLEFRSFLLRPSPEPRTQEAFEHYTRSWKRPAAAEPEAGFRVWASGEAPPSHSTPAHVASKAVAAHHHDLWRAFHEAMLRAYFVDNRTISDIGVMVDVAASVGIDGPQLRDVLRAQGREFEAQVIAEHVDAIEHGITAVPTVVVSVDDEPKHVLRGAVEVDDYRRALTQVAD